MTGISPIPLTAMLRRTAPLALGLIALALPAAAQDTVTVRADTVLVTTVVRETTYVVEAVRAERRFNASPPLAEEHWAVRAAARAEALGLAPRYAPAQRAVPRQAVASVLAEARMRAGGRPALAALAEGWWARFVEEFPEYEAPPERAGLVLLGRSAALGYGENEGRLAPGVGYLASEQPPLPIEDESGVRATAGGAVALGGVASLGLEARIAGDEELDLVRWDATVGAGAFALSAGRGDVGYGYGRWGGVVLSPRDAFTRVELQTTRPIRLPWVLGYLGDVSAHTFVTRMDEARHPTEPWLWGMRIAARPHPRFTLGLHRASIFGGEGREVTVEKLAKLLVGVIRSDFENQIVSGEARWQLPTDAVLPATVYLEWGADDGAGAISETPGRVAGVFLPALPGLPQVALGAEYAHFAEACCGHGAWYHNATFPGNWARGDQPLGHPLGGEGWEASGYGQAELFDARLRLEGRFFARDYSDESAAIDRRGNLFAPVRVGRSNGGSLEAAMRLPLRADLRAGFFLEDGEDWREHAFHAELAVFF